MLKNALFSIFDIIKINIYFFSFLLSLSFCTINAPSLSTKFMFSPVVPAVHQNKLAKLLEDTVEIFVPSSVQMFS